MVQVHPRSVTHRREHLKSKCVCKAPRRPGVVWHQHGPLRECRGERLPSKLLPCSVAVDGRCDLQTGPVSALVDVSYTKPDDSTPRCLRCAMHQGVQCCEVHKEGSHPVRVQLRRKGRDWRLVKLNAGRVGPLGNRAWDQRFRKKVETVPHVRQGSEPRRVAGNSGIANRDDAPVKEGTTSKVRLSINKRRVVQRMRGNNVKASCRLPQLGQTFLRRLCADQRMHRNRNVILFSTLCSHRSVAKPHLDASIRASDSPGGRSPGS
mmetsp:Transcript_5360/g.17278  ORF Transcript_5360/g.17278 Transcript_5360/m.17278 type:complete len:264 (+) Transcript_5360:379-1170(+)